MVPADSAAPPAAGGGELAVWRCELVWSPAARKVSCRTVTLQGPVTAWRVLTALKSDPDVARLARDDWQPGCWGRRVGWDDELPVPARVELYRALTVDPKEARRQRFRAQGPVGRFRRRALEG
jgi:uncharacterized protein